MKSFDIIDLTRSLQLALNYDDISITNPVFMQKTKDAIIPFAIIIAVSSALILFALGAFLKIGIAKGRRKREMVSGWFISVFRPTVLGKDLNFSS